MRIKVIQIPAVAEVDGVSLAMFRPGVEYEMGIRLGALFLAAGWAIPIDATEPTALIPIREWGADDDTGNPRTLMRAVWSSDHDALPVAADRGPRPRRPSERRN